MTEKIEILQNQDIKCKVTSALDHSNYVILLHKLDKLVFNNYTCYM